jgi:predicted membrane protein
MHPIFEQFSNHIGIVGVILTLIAYFLISMNKVTSSSLSYVWLNLIGAILLLYSLLFHWNLSSVLIEIAWISISLLGLYRAVWGSNKPQKKSEQTALNLEI